MRSNETMDQLASVGCDTTTPVQGPPGIDTEPHRSVPPTTDTGPSQAIEMLHQGLARRGGEAAVGNCLVHARLSSIEST